jgi:cellobiose phosphorylase
LSARQQNADVIRFETLATFGTAELLTHRALQGIVIDSREEHKEKVFGSMCVYSESVSNEIDESELRFGKHDEDNRQIMIDFRDEREIAQNWIRAGFE